MLANLQPPGGVENYSGRFARSPLGCYSLGVSDSELRQGAQWLLIKYLDRCIENAECVASSFPRYALEAAVWRNFNRQLRKIKKEVENETPDACGFSPSSS